MTTFTIASAIEGRNALGYFNGFHDGFIKRIEIVFPQQFTEDYSMECVDVFDAILEIAHYNYGQRRQPYDTIIRCRFEAVRRLSLGFGALNDLNWSIDALEIQDDAGKMALVLHHSQYDGHCWAKCANRLFSFASAVISDDNGGSKISLLSLLRIFVDKILSLNKNL